MNYDISAKERISSFGADEIGRFISEIPRHWAKEYVFVKMPPIAGFRRDSDPGCEEQKRRLIGRLADLKNNARTGERDWHYFKHLWVLWAERHLEHEKIENRLRRIASVDASDQKALDEAMNNLISSCQELIEKKKLSRETLQRFVDYSPLPIEAFGMVIASAPSEAEIARVQKELELWERLEASESRLEAVSKLLENTVDRSQLESVKTTLSDIDGKVQGLDSSVAKLALSGNGSLDSKAVADRFAALEQGYAKVQAAVTTAIESQDGEDVLKRVDALAAKCHELEHAVSDLSLQLSNERHDVNLVQPVPEDEPPHSPSDGTPVAILPRDYFSDPVPKTCVSADSVLQVLQKNLSAIGLTSGAASSASREIAASVWAGQMLFFAGPMADVVAEAAAVSMSGFSVRRFDVSVGLENGREITKLFERCAQEASSLLLRGVNLSCFEVYAGALQQSVTSHQLKCAFKPKAPFLFGTLSRSVATLPMPAGASELGPTIHTGALSWKIPTGPIGQLAPGVLTVESAPKLKTQETAAELVGELFEQLRQQTAAIDTLLERTALNAACLLAEWYTNDQRHTHEQQLFESLLCAWIIPWLLRSELRKKSAEIVQALCKAKYEVPERARQLCSIASKDL